MIYNFLEITLLSIIQGISEFLPVSSSAHLYLVSEIYQFRSQSLMIDVALHLGSLIAIIFYFRNELVDIFKNKKLLYLLVLGSIPLVIVGLLIFSTGLINNLRNLEVVAWTTLIFAIILFIADKFKIRKKLNTNLNIKIIFLIGLFQTLSVIPGVSRSGIVITAGRFLNFDRFDSTKISFFLSIPAIAGASILTLKDLTYKALDFNIIILFAVIFAFIISYLSIKYFLIFTKRFSMTIFVIYRIVLSFILFYIIYY